MIPPPPTSTLFPYTTLFRSTPKQAQAPVIMRNPEPVEAQPPVSVADLHPAQEPMTAIAAQPAVAEPVDRKSTRLNSSHVEISYAVFCLKKKKHIFTACL